MKRFMTKKVVAIGLTAGLVLGGAGVAFAYWTSTGSGTGSATTGTHVDNLTFTDTTSALNAMAPGVAAKAISGTVINNNATGGQKQYVSTVTATIASVTETSTELGLYGSDGITPGTSTIAYLCSPSDYTLTNPAMTVATDLAPQASHPFSGDSIAFNDTGSNQNACQGATVGLTFTSN